MQKFKSRKFLAIALAVVMTLSLSITAFAAWPSFQSNRWNNGLITNGTPPITQPALVNSVGLSTNNPTGNVYSGIDNATVMNTVGGVTTAYTLYNGGVRNGNLGGARLAITDVASGSVHNIMVDPDANNVAQLSTPYLNTTTNNLYAATTRYIDILNKGTTSIATGIHSMTATIVIPSDYWEPTITFTFPNFVNATGFSASATLGGAYTFTNGYFNTPTGGTSYTIYYDGVQRIPAGTYTLTITTNNTSGATLSASHISFLVSAWKFWRINVGAATPTVTQIGTGYGQANTHIDYYADTNFVFFGIYEGDRSYYLYNQGTSTLVRFNAQDDFYWAGAYQQRLTGNGEVFFGSDDGKLYIKDPTNFASGTGTIVDLKTIVSDAGKVRSTVMALESGTGYAYFTSTGTGNHGYLWRIDLSTVASGHPVLTYVQISLSNASVSSTTTPVISNNIVYVGANGYQTTAPYAAAGAVQAFNATTLAKVVDVYVGDPVQASPIVYASSPWNYVYFTTNSSTGAGYCYRHNWNSTVVQSIWTAGGTSSNRYAVQGFSADNGYLVYGDDGNNLYIMH